MTNVLQIAIDKLGNLKSIYDVKTGIECECFCPECKSPLEAKNKNKASNESLTKGQRIAHFAHSDGSFCSSAQETAIHLLAKKILAETKILTIPSLCLENIILAEERRIIFDFAEVEKEIRNEELIIKPDVILTKNNRELFIEFFKTHRVDDTKIQKIKFLGISCIEIDLNHIDPLVDGQINTTELRTVIEDNSNFKNWLYNSQAENLLVKEKNRILVEEQEKKRIRELEVEITKNEEDLTAKVKAQKDARIKEWKKKLIAEGYDFLKVYEYVHWEYETYYNEYNGRSKTYKRFQSKDVNVYCPKQMENGKNKRIEMGECENCTHHKGIIYEEKFERRIACGFRNDMTGK